MGTHVHNKEKVHEGGKLDNERWTHPHFYNIGKRYPPGFPYDSTFLVRMDLWQIRQMKNWMLAKIGNFQIHLDLSYWASLIPFLSREKPKVTNYCSILSFRLEIQTPASSMGECIVGFKSSTDIVWVGKMSEYSIIAPIIDPKHL